MSSEQKSSWPVTIAIAVIGLILTAILLIL